MVSITLASCLKSNSSLICEPSSSTGETRSNDSSVSCRKAAAILILTRSCSMTCRTEARQPEKVYHTFAGSLLMPGRLTWCHQRSSLLNLDKLLPFAALYRAQQHGLEVASMRAMCRQVNISAYIICRQLYGDYDQAAYIPCGHHAVSSLTGCSPPEHPHTAPSPPPLCLSS